MERDLVEPVRRRRQLVNKMKVLYLLILILALPSVSCNREEREAKETYTISPAEPTQSPNSADTETALTETVEIGEERSPNEGGVLTDDTPTKPSKGSGATTTTNPNAPRNSPPGTPPQP